MRKKEKWDFDLKGMHTYNDDFLLTTLKHLSFDEQQKMRKAIKEMTYNMCRDFDEHMKRWMTGEVTFDNNSRIIKVSGSDKTVHGYSTDLLEVDGFDIIEDES